MKDLEWREFDGVVDGEHRKVKSVYSTDGKMAANFGRSERILPSVDKDGKIRPAKIQTIFMTLYTFL